MQSRSSLVILSGALTLAACGSEGLVTEGRTPVSTNTMSYGSRVHTMPKQQPADSANAQPAGASGTPQLTYYGGPVISSVRVYTVYWSAAVNYQSQLNQFYQAITQSSYFDWLSEYNTPTQSIGRGSFGGTVLDSSAPAGTTIDDSAIQGEVARLINAGQLPPNSDGNNLYMFYFPPGVTITQGGQSSCQQFCAYHGTFQQGSQNVYYGVVPDQGGSCAQGCDASDQLSNTTSVSSHEMLEAVTDAAVGIAPSLGAPLAWYDQTNGEIGDICNAQQGQVDGYTVQLEWSNQQGTCVASAPGTTAPPTSGTPSGSSAGTSSSTGGCDCASLGCSQQGLTCEPTQCACVSAPSGGTTGAPPASPSGGAMCSTCSTNADCGAGYCVFESSSSATGYCAAPCSTGADCASNAQCFYVDSNNDMGCYPSSQTCVGGA